jgi:predicted aldo/keto reductase-like oxidoreductase
MKYLKKDQTEEIKVNDEVDFNKNGKQVASTKEKVFAKIVQSEKNNNYLIKTYNNEIYDPMGLNSNRERFLQTKLKKVSKDTFDFYLIYLQTNNSIYLTRANRRFINE